ncbi:General secretion pathway protein F [Thermogutta terrifontis]|uniref:General secretion pathway protein F n=1 Tax=Thermogutta terrifontis TaxID=1331910 RepID=A0A286RE54_9BACT|nr:type II secretion system F family protein [Thermogutta terrifontis]ASV74248.1 General secretion pathway protein F [Thermogutta terrifontis]
MSQPHSSSSRGSSLSATEFLTLHRQIASLVKLGLPLEGFLARWNVGGSRRWRKTVQQISEALRQGIPLEEALQRVEKDLAPVYGAVLRLGNRSAQTGAILADIGRFGERAIAIRNQLVASLVYPLVVFLAALGLLAGFLAFIFPVLLESMRDWGADGSGLLRLLEALRAGLPYWVLAGALVPLALFLFWTLLIHRTRILMPDYFVWRLGWFPGVRGIVRSEQVAVFTDLLSLGIQHGVPVDEAVRLAGTILGDRTWREEANRLADAIGAQNWSAALAKDYSRIPAGVRLTIVHGITSPRLADSLKSLAEQWGNRCQRRMQVFRTVTVPLAIIIPSVIIVLGIIFIFGWPWWSLLLKMAEFRP